MRRAVRSGYVKNASGPITSAPARSWTKVAKDRIEVAFGAGVAGHGAAARGCGPPPAGLSIGPRQVGLVGLTSTAMMVAVGTNSCSSSSRFGPSSALIRGHAREVAARSVQAGDKSDRDRVAAGHEDDRNRRGRRLCRPGPQECWPRQSRSPDDEPDRPPAPAIDRIGPPPSGIRSRRCGPRHSRFRSGLGGTRGRRPANRSGDSLPRKPITGIAGCCAYAASGQAAATLPSVPMNCRRPMWIVM